MTSYLPLRSVLLLDTSVTPASVVGIVLLRNSEMKITATLAP